MSASPGTNIWSHKVRERFDLSSPFSSPRFSVTICIPTSRDFSGIWIKTAPDSRVIVPAPCRASSAAMYYDRPNTPSLGLLCSPHATMRLQDSILASLRPGVSDFIHIAWPSNNLQTKACAMPGNSFVVSSLGRNVPPRSNFFLGVDVVIFHHGHHVTAARETCI